jgi:hypothetical protein
MQDSTPTNLDDSTDTGAPLIVPDEPAAEELAPRTVNSVDATVGQPIVIRVMARKTELEALLAALPAEDINTRGDIGLALSTINELLTGDLASVPAVVAADMNRWLERNKHLAERAST